MEQADGPSARLPTRATRGKRLTKLIEDEDEADQAFWNQDAFNEEDQEEYAAEEEEQDVFDSDFDDDEDLEDDGDDEEDERPRKRRKAPPGAAPKRPVRQAAAASKAAVGPKAPAKSFEAVFQDRLAGAGAANKAPKAKAAVAKRPRAELDGDPAWAEGVERRSKRAVVVERNVEREQEEKQRARSRKTVAKKKPVVEERRLTQDEMLAEAAQTEIANLQSLEIMLAREEEIKRKAVIHKEAFAGPQIRFHSKNGRTVLEFTRVDAFPAVINSKAPPYPPRALCAITGLPARYKDPLTGQPYATLEAFKQLRERWNDRGKRPRPASTSDDPPGRRRAKLEATENVKLMSSALGLRRAGQKNAQDSPTPSRGGRPERRASPREGLSPGTSSQERSPGPSSAADLPPSRLSLQSGGAERPLAVSELGQPLPSLRDVTIEDFDVHDERGPRIDGGSGPGVAANLREESAPKAAVVEDTGYQKGQVRTELAPTDEDSGGFVQAAGVDWGMARKEGGSNSQQLVGSRMPEDPGSTKRSAEQETGVAVENFERNGGLLDGSDSLVRQGDNLFKLGVEGAAEVAGQRLLDDATQKS